MVRLVGVQGSPRKNRKTETLLRHPSRRRRRRVGDDEIGLSYAAGVGRRVADVAAALKR
jgi:hypothetical protein